MNTQTFYRILSILLVIVFVLGSLCVLGGIALAVVSGRDHGNSAETTPPAESTHAPDLPTQADPKDVILSETADAGQAYIDSMIFFGESTTAHLRARGVLTDGKETKQVWADSSGTRLLSSQITLLPIIYPDTGESLSIAQACEAKKPQYLVLSFGLNGITEFIQNKSAYVNYYGKLIKAVQAASPNTKIILQTVYPVCGAENYSVDVDTLNSYIMTLNGWLPEIAAAYENVRVADTASVLRDADGKLATVYDNGDGIHLTASAYEEILQYLRTHAWDATNE